MTLADPDLAAMLAHIHAGTVPPEVAVDWLQDHDATLADVLVLYAGTAAGKWLDGVPYSVLGEWCLATEAEGSRGLTVWSCGRRRHGLTLMGDDGFRRDLKRRILSLFPEVSIVSRIPAPGMDSGRTCDACQNEVSPDGRLRRHWNSKAVVSPGSFAAKCGEKTYVDCELGYERMPPGPWEMVQIIKAPDLVPSELAITRIIRGQ